MTVYWCGCRLLAVVQAGVAKSWGKRAVATASDGGSTGRDGKGVGGCGVGGRGDGTQWTGVRVMGSGNSLTVMLSRGMWSWRL